MTARSAERLYTMLPAIYRSRDFAEGEPLRALLGVLDAELDRIEKDIDGLYDNWFIETCDEWAVPYVGDLVAARLLHAVSQRAFTANTLAYRRRKGTLQTLSALARDVTGWTARGVEYLQLVATTQQVNSARPSNIVIPDLSQLDALDRVNTPFERTAHTVSIRSGGRYHRDQVGLYVWRLGSYALERVRAVPVAAQPGCFYINPLGCDTALFSPGSSRPGLAVTAEPHSVPQRLKRPLLQRTLEARRQALADGRTPQDPYFDGQPVLRVYVAGTDGVLQEVPAEQVLIADLDSFWTPPSARTYRRSTGGSPVSLPIRVAVDPERGRLTFPLGQVPAQVYTSYYYGFAGELGGGGYDRETSAPAPGLRVVAVSAGDVAGTLGQLADSSQRGSPWDGAAGQLCIELGDSDSYSVGALAVPAGGVLWLRARSAQRPLLLPSGSADGRWHITLGTDATLILDGLLVAGGLTLAGVPGAAAPSTGTRVRLSHSTLVPGLGLLGNGAPQSPNSPSVQTESALAEVELWVDRSICGAVDFSAPALTAARITATDSIFDGTGSSRPTLAAARASLTRVTVLGRTAVAALEATLDSLFCGAVSAPTGPEGGVRYCYLPTGSLVPSPYRCQPALALAGPAVDPVRTGLLLVPWLVSRRYGTPGYGQLDWRCHSAIRNGASVEGELGALHSLQQAQREANLLDSQTEYLRFGITLNLFPVT